MYMLVYGEYYGQVYKVYNTTQQQLSTIYYVGKWTRVAQNI